MLQMWTAEYADNADLRRNESWAAWSAFSA